MKTTPPFARPRPPREGSAVLIILVLMAFMVVLATANTVTLNTLRKRVKIIDQRQTQRLAGLSASAPRAIGASNPSPPSP